MRLIAVATVAIVLVGCAGGSSQSQQRQAASFVAKHGQDARHVIGDMAKVQVAMAYIGTGATPELVDELATTAQEVHDDLADGKYAFLAGDGSGEVGDALASLYDAVNGLKNSMGAIVAFTGDPSPATQAKMTTQYETAVAEWNSAVTTIWAAAGTADAPPTI